MTTKPKLYSKEDRYNIVDYDDDDFMRNLYSPPGSLETGGFHVDYEMWMARKKHDGTWTAADEAIEEKRQSKINKAFFRYRQEQTRERVLKRLASVAAEPRTRSGRKPGWFHRKTGRPFPLVGKAKTLVGRGRRTRRRKRRRTRKRRGGGGNKIPQTKQQQRSTLLWLISPAYRRLSRKIDKGKRRKIIIQQVQKQAEEHGLMITKKQISEDLKDLPDMEQYHHSHLLNRYLIQQEQAQERGKTRKNKPGGGRKRRRRAKRRTRKYRNKN